MGGKLRLLFAVSALTTALAVPFGGAALGAPASQAAPAVVDDGTPADGELVSAANGTWSPTPTSFAYQWSRCDAAGSACADVAGATARTYRLSAADVGGTVRVAVSADGSAPVLSAPGNLVSARPAASTAAPVVTGSANDGQTLSVSTGSWSGTDPISFSYQWQRCGSYQQTVLGDSPAGYWRLGDAGQSAPDLSGLGRNGTYVGGASAVGGALAGDPNGATAFSNGRVDVPNVPNSVFASGFTLEAWVKVNAAQTDRGIAGKWRYADGGGAMLWLSGNGTYAFVVTRGNFNYLVTTVTPTPGSWDHIVGTWDGQRLRLYRNGVAIGVKTWSGSAGNPTGDFSIASYGGGQYLNGAVDDVAIYSRALSAADVKRHYDTGANDCVDIPGATSATYAVTAADSGTALRAVVTGSNAQLFGGGSDVGRSAISAVVRGPLPAATTAPAVTGTAQEGNLLTASSGDWSGTPTSYAYQWRRCGGTPYACADVVGATSSSYRLGAADVGSKLRVVVTATNAGGSASAASATTAVVLPAPPVNAVAPALAGTAEELQTLTASPGAWTSSALVGYAYAWQRCDAAGGACVPIAGATADHYGVAKADIGSTLRVVVTATNDGGSATATSSATAVVVAERVAPTVSLTAPAGGSLLAGSVALSADAADNVGVASVRFTLDGAPLGDPDTTAPYGAAWNTATATDGAHVLRAVATDAAGNSTASAPVSVTVDNSAPVARITRGPAALSNDASPSLAFAADEAGAVFACSLDGAPYAACTSPAAYAGLAQGDHVFSVRASDAAGNTGAAATRSWTIDLTAPAVALDGTPADPSRSGSASFAFSSEAGAAFECALDGAAFASCASPQSYTALADGAHTFAVRATDGAGNVSAAKSYGWTIDSTAPDTSIAGAPADPTNATSATISFSAGEAGATFECSLDGAAFAACTSPKSYTGLAEGAHTFAVRATDAAGNTDASPASASWHVDTTAPAASIDSHPADATSSSAARFTFSSEPGAKLECSLDGGPFAACASPADFVALADGAHTFAVRATDAAGNTGAAASYRWTIDTAAPAASIDAKPSDPSGSAAATFGFSSEPGASLACSLDGAAFAACTSPKSYAGLADGPHTFAVYATDAVGNVGATATYGWTVDTAGAAAAIASGPADPTSSTAASFSFTSEPGATFACSLDAGAFAACSSPTSYTGLADGAHTFAVRATDAAGNTGVPASYRWTVDTVAPAASIDAKPADPSKDASPSFGFSSEAGAALECSLDGAAFAACTSPKSYAGLADGAHTFAVRATDAAGNTGAAASYGWTIDTVGAAATIDAHPDALSRDPSPSFAFSSEQGASLECSLDGAAFAACTSPKSYAALADGAHSFAVRATDAAGNAGAAATWNWTIDTAAPAASIGATPGDPTNATAATFTFSSEAGAGFACSLDGGAFAPCASPASYAGLAEGAHSFAVRASDAAGNTGAAATYGWTVDTTAPGVSLDSRPPAASNNALAVFAFSSDPGARFECDLDGAGFARCDSPAAYAALADGQHRFSVRATDPAGNTSAAVAYSWTVDTIAPTATVDSGPADPSSATAVLLSFSSEPGATLACSLDGAVFAACTSPARYSALADGLHAFQVRATDAAGNTGAAATYRWTTDTVGATATVNSGPAALTRLTSASLAFSSEAGARFECALDGAAFAACTSPQGYAGLADGAHTFQVRATDLAGNTGAAASYGWTVDTTAPAISLDGKPADPSKNASPSFAFTSEAGATLACSLDGAAYAACSSPQGYAGLADGAHSFAVRATDRAGNTSAPATWNWTIDTVAPAATIDAKPSDPSKDAGPSFSFSSEAGAKLECALDAAAFSACTSPIGYASLADGAHSFAVRATDAAGNVGTPASWKWTVDTTAPVASIDSKPSDPSKDTAPSFAFSSEPGATLECALDGAAFAPCTSPKSYTGLADGAHSFAVRATDAAGNTGAAATYSWTIKTLGPAVTIVSGPADPSNDTAPSFVFTAVEAGATFQCDLDGAGYSACTSPKSYTGLAQGAHAFHVRALDLLGNLGVVATYTWTLDTTAPAATIVQRPTDPSRSSAPSFSFSAEAGATFACSLDGAAFAACTSPKSYTGVADGAHTFAVRATDAAGNTGAAANAAWTIDATAPTGSITAPAAGATVSATVTVSAAASDAGTGVAGVQFKLDGVNLGAEDTTAPYSIAWDTTTAAAGSHTLSAVVRDTAGNLGSAPIVGVTVQNAPTPDPNAFKKVDLGGGFVDANTHNVVRTKGDRVYVFAADDGPVWQKTGQGLIHAYRADQTGVPTTFSEADALNRPHSASSVLNKLPGIDTRLDINGIVHAVYVDNGFPVTLNYTTFNTNTDKWGPVETIASSQDTEDRGRGKFAIVLDNSEKPQVVFMKGTAVMYTNRNAGTWSTPVTIATSTKPLHPSLAFDSSGTLHLAWMDDACSTCGSIKYMNRSAAGVWSAVETAAGSDVLNNANADQGTSIVVTSTGRVCVNYLSAAPGSAVRVTCRAAANTWNADPLPTNIYAHTPQLYSRNDDLYVFLGHDVNINYGYTYHLAGQGWSPYKVLLAETHDGSASTRWDPRRDNNPNVIDTAFFDEDILKTRTWIPEVYYMAVLPN